MAVMTAISSSAKGWMALLPGELDRKAYLAALCLVAIQVSIGIVMKSSQSSGGKYDFSPSASVTISEFFKLLLSAIFFWVECRERASQGEQPKGSHVRYEPLSNLADSPGDYQTDDGLDDMEMRGMARHENGRPARLGVSLYWQYLHNEITSRTRWELCNLALLYLLVNNTIFACYKQADPGTIALIKSGITVVTALVMITALGSSVAGLQWTAIVLQLCGLVVTQYQPDTGIAYPAHTYMLLLFHVFLGASAGVYNQVLLKRESASIHVMNMTLYAAGAVFNFAGHNLVRLVHPGEPGFLHGYGSIAAILVIFSNVFVGLAITAVLKYADAVIKCFATAFATGILLYISPILFGTELGFLAIPGTVIVFVASWMYITNPPPPKKSPDDSDPPSRWSPIALLSDAVHKWPIAILAVAVIGTGGFVVLLWAPERVLIQPSTDTPGVATFESPFKNTMAYVRWNHAIPERVPTVMKYAPFFHTMHISMKDSIEGQPMEYLNLTHDQFNNTGHPHKPVAATMRLIIEEEIDIDGIFFFHFDAWVNPMGFMGMDLTRMAIPFDGGPLFRCYDTLQTDSWGGDQKADFYESVGVASRMQPPVLPDDSELLPDPKHYTARRAGCRGWSDIYFIPRRFFADYIFLVENIYAEMWHEMAVSTMMHMMDRTRSRSPSTSFIDPMPCWGSCCAEHPSVDTILWNRCGHKLDYRDEKVAGAHFNRVDKSARKLGTPMDDLS